MLLPATVADVASIAHTAPAAEPDDSPPARKSVTLQTDLITPFFGAYYLEANVRVSSHFGVLFNTSYLAFPNGDWKSRTGTFGVGLTYHFGGEALRGWYVEGVGEANLSSWRNEPSGQVAPLGVGWTGILVGGYRFVWNSGFVLDLAAGLVVLHLSSARVTTAEGVVASDALTRVYPAAKLGVGWAF